MIDEITTVLEPRPLPDFVESKYVKEISERAVLYLKAGFPIHFRGPSGTGKTTLAMNVASKIGRPVVMIHGDEEFTTSDLVGGEYGYRFKKVVDRFVSRVLKVEEDMIKRWVDNRLTVACKYGFTLIYDEFTRSRPEANNILLSILQEKMMDLPVGRGEDPYLKVDPDFTAIFTSNPEEYAGVHRSQDALRDRMITMDLDHFDYDTEAKSPLEKLIAFIKYKLVKNRLLNKRDNFIAKRIDETLNHKKKGIIFIGAFHNIKKRLSKSFLITEIKNTEKVREYQKLIPFYNKNRERFEELAGHLISKVKV